MKSFLLLERKKRARRLIRVLTKLYPNADMILNWKTPWELVVAVQLSAQCTDKMVNRITEKLFKKYRTLAAYVNANVSEFEQDIKSSGFYRNKAKNILAAARMVQEKYRGNVPDTMEELLTLPGVARKTANVVLGNAFNRFDGIAVDTHVRRFAIQYDLSDYTDPVRIEKDLQQIIPKKDWFRFTYLAIEYGRQLAPAGGKRKGVDPLLKIYPEAQSRWPLKQKITR
jgi:endonuclease-3